MASEHLEPYQQSYTLYRIGQVHARLKQWAEAEESYKAAVKIDGHKSAKKALDRMKKHKKEGKISY